MHPKAIRRSVVHDWRGLPDESDAEPSSPSVAGILTTLVPKLGLADRVDEDEMRRLWSSIVGDFLAAHSAPENLRGGVLTVGVVQPSVRYELERSWKPVILANLRKHFGAGRIRDVRFR